jgi:N-acetylglucosamine kinase-like BadF-type ATPase
MTSSAKNKQYFLGVDAGGSKTHALLADENGTALGFGAGGAGNHQGVGFDGLQAVLHQVVTDALGMAGVTIDRVAGAGFGLAGFDWECQRQDHLDIIATLGMICPVGLVNDASLGLRGGTSQGWGVAVVAGTGNNCRSRSRQGKEGRATGEGWLFGEFGSGGDIVGRAIQMANYEWLQRIPHSRLSDALIQKVGAKDLYDFIEGIDLGRYDLDANLARLVFQMAYEGCPLAGEVIAWNARELGETACGAIRQAGMEDEACEVVMVGGVFEGGVLYIEPFKEVVLRTAPKAQFVRMNVPPVIGGALLGMEQVFGDVAYQNRAKLIETTCELLEGNHAEEG